MASQSRRPLFRGGLRELVEKLRQKKDADAAMEYLRKVAAETGLQIRGSIPVAAGAAGAPVPSPRTREDPVPGLEDFPPLGQAAGDSPPTPSSAPAPREQRPSAATAGEKKKKKVGKRLKQQIPVTFHKGVMHVHFDGLPPPRAREGPGGPPGPGGRIILAGDRRVGRRRIGSRLRGECNGAVLDGRDWSPLSVPPRALSAGAPHAEVDRLLAEGAYDIVQASDSTVATIYEWDGLWCVSTSHGYDVSQLQWMGPKTYAEILYELLAAHPDCVETTGLRLSGGRLAFDRLDPAYCYTVGFRHHDFHPFRPDPPGVWNIQAVARGTPPYTPTYDLGLPGLPRQFVYGEQDLASALSTAAGTPPTVRALAASLAGAVETAKAAATAAVSAPSESAAASKSAAADSPSESAPERRVSPFAYGYILRAKDHGRGLPDGLSDVLVESPLLVRIRSLVYRRPPVRDREKLSPEDRFEYAAARAFLTESLRDEFLGYFPEAREIFNRYDSFVRNITRLIVARDRAERQGAADAPAPAARTAAQQIAEAILKGVQKQQPQFRPFSRDSYSIVNDYVVRPEHALLYMQALKKTKRAPAE